MSLIDLLIHVLEIGASDLHITAGAPPTVRLNGGLLAVEGYPKMTPPVIQRMLHQRRRGPRTRTALRAAGWACTGQERRYCVTGTPSYSGASAWSAGNNGLKKGTACP